MLDLETSNFKSFSLHLHSISFLSLLGERVTGGIRSPYLGFNQCFSPTGVRSTPLPVPRNTGENNTPIVQPDLPFSYPFPSLTLPLPVALHPFTPPSTLTCPLSTHDKTYSFNFPSSLLFTSALHLDRRTSCLSFHCALLLVVI